MKMTIKSITAVLLGWLTYLNDTFTPLFWILIALVALDLLFSAHKEGQQFMKIGSMALSLGVPSYIASNLSNPQLGKYLVAIMCLVYLQIVVPLMLDKVKSWTFSKDPKQNASDQATIQALIQKVEAMEQAKAQSLVRAVAQDSGPAIIQDGGEGVR